MDQPSEKEKKSNKTILVIIIAIIVIGAGVGIFFATQNKNTNTTTGSTNTTAKTNTATDLYAGLRKYDGKIITISSADGKVSGQIAIVFRMSEKMPIQVVYFFKVKDVLAKKATSFAGESYHYIASHDKASDIRLDVGTGILSAAFCNTDQTPDILAMAKAGNLNVSTYDGCASQYDVYASTDTFYHIYAAYYNNYTFDYNEMVSKDTLAVFDASPYYISDATTGGYQMDRAKAIQEGTIAAQYNLTYAE